MFMKLARAFQQWLILDPLERAIAREHPYATRADIEALVLANHEKRGEQAAYLLLTGDRSR
jgi:hypothetical protein